MTNEQTSNLHTPPAQQELPLCMFGPGGSYVTTWEPVLCARGKAKRSLVFRQFVKVCRWQRNAKRLLVHRLPRGTRAAVQLAMHKADVALHWLARELCQAAGWLVHRLMDHGADMVAGQPAQTTNMMAAGLSARQQHLTIQELHYAERRNADATTTGNLAGDSGRAKAEWLFPDLAGNGRRTRP